MVGHISLEDVILVRVQVRQQIRSIATSFVPEVTELLQSRPGLEDRRHILPAGKMVRSGPRKNVSDGEHFIRGDAGPAVYLSTCVFRAIILYMTEEFKPGPHHHMTPDEIKRGCLEEQGTNANGVRICRINQELSQGMHDMEAYDKAVTFYGSARFKEGDEFYDKARHLGNRISKELGYAIVTGGGPGIMEGGNRGAFEAGGKSIGLTIKLPMEQKDNPYLTDEVPFFYFFTRKVALSFSSEVFVFFPGGFGTMDEFFEQLTLVQTGKVKPIPMVLYGSEFWKPLEKFFQEIMVDKFKTVSPAEMKLFTITDNDDEVIEIIKNAKSRKENHGD